MVFGNNLNQIYNSKWNKGYGLCSLSGLFIGVVSFVIDVANVLTHASTHALITLCMVGHYSNWDIANSKNIITYWALLIGMAPHGSECQNRRAR